MTYEQQKQEILTIQERQIPIKLTSADCERVMKLCALNDITVAQLLEGFIGDLVNGTYTNGSDERDLARQYFDRCCYPYKSTTLLKYLLKNGYDIYTDFLKIIKKISYLHKDLEEYKEDPSRFEDYEIEWIKSDLAELEEQIKEIKEDFSKENENFIWKNEVEEVYEFWKEKQILLNQKHIERIPLNV